MDRLYVSYINVHLGTTSQPFTEVSPAVRARNDAIVLKKSREQSGKLRQVSEECLRIIPETFWLPWASGPGGMHEASMAVWVLRVQKASARGKLIPKCVCVHIYIYIYICCTILTEEITGQKTCFL